MSNDIAKVTLDVVRAAMALAERDVELKHIDVDDIRNLTRSRFAPVERKHAVALLKAQGKSNREIAKELDCNEGTVRGDLGGKRRAEKSAENAEKSAGSGGDGKGTTKGFLNDMAKKGYTIESGKPDKIREDNDLNKFVMNCHAAASVAVYGGRINDKAISACRMAAKAWSDLLRKMESTSGKESEESEESEASNVAYLQAKAP